MTTRIAVDEAPTPSALPAPTPPVQATAEPAQPVVAAPLMVVGPGTTTPFPTPAANTNPSPAIVAIAPSESCELAEEPINPSPPTWFSDDFATPRPEWRPLASNWSVESGSFVQGNPDGYDPIVKRAVPLPNSVSISVEMSPEVTRSAAG
jgi:hypothetical protein